MEINTEECEILLKHLIKQQEGCMFLGEISDIVKKLEEETGAESYKYYED